MRRHHGRVGFLGLAVASLWLMVGVAAADVTTEHSASILVFPKVIADGTRDTIIQITNTSNSVVRAHCFYVNGALTDPTQPQGPLNPPLWQEVDFDIILTKQQPTHWTVSRGRNVNPLDAACGPGDGVCIGGGNAGMTCTWHSDCPDSLCSNTGCDNAGFDPGLIPPVVPDFVGELKCVEVDPSGAPLSGNHMKGEATLVTLATGDVSKYNGIGILGNENNGDGTLVLGGGQCVGAGALTGVVCESDEQCGESAPCAMEYNGCPQTWFVNTFAEGAQSLALANLTAVPSNVFTELTFVPCTQNFETQEPTRITVQFLGIDEFESIFSVSTSVTCWGNFFLNQLGAPAFLAAATETMVGSGAGFQFQSDFRSWALTIRLRDASGIGPGQGRGFLVVPEQHMLTWLSPADRESVAPDVYVHLPANFGELLPQGTVTSAMADAHHEGQVSGTNRITIPAEQLAP